MIKITNSYFHIQIIKTKLRMSSLHEYILGEIDLIINKQYHEGEFFTFVENELFRQYIRYVDKQYGLQCPSQMANSDKKSNNKTNKKRIILKSIKKSLSDAPQQTYLQISGAKISVKNSPLCTKLTKNQSTTHTRSKSDCIPSIGGIKSINLQTAEYTNQKAKNDQCNSDRSDNISDFEFKDMGVTEFIVEDEIDNNSETQVNNVVHEYKKKIEHKMKICFGCEEFLTQEEISLHEMKCPKIGELYKLSDQQLVSESESKLSMKKSDLLERTENKNQSSQLYLHIKEYIRVLEEQDKRKMIELESMIQNESNQLIDCIQQFEKVRNYRQVRSALENYSSRIMNHQLQ